MIQACDRGIFYEKYSFLQGFEGSLKRNLQGGLCSLKKVGSDLFGILPNCHANSWSSASVGWTVYLISGLCFLVGN